MSEDDAADCGAGPSVVPDAALEGYPPFYTYLCGRLDRMQLHSDGRIDELALSHQTFISGHQSYMDQQSSYMTQQFGCMERQTNYPPQGGSSSSKVSYPYPSPPPPPYR